MRRTIEHLLKRIREELRAEGPDGAGYSDFLIKDAINSALQDLSEVFPVRDVIEFLTTKEDGEDGAVHTTYDLVEQATGSNILSIIKVEYDGERLELLPMKDYLNRAVTDEGSVREWVMWGNSFTLVGEVESGKTVTLWVTRTPKQLKDRGDIPETPDFADEAIIAFAMSVCYRESKDYERANFHYGIFLKQKDDVLRRAIPQGQRDANPVMNASYWGPYRKTRAERPFNIRSDN